MSPPPWHLGPACLHLRTPPCRRPFHCAASPASPWLLTTNAVGWMQCIGACPHATALTLHAAMAPLSIARRARATPTANRAQTTHGTCRSCHNGTYLCHANVCVFAGLARPRAMCILTPQFVRHSSDPQLVRACSLLCAMCLHLGPHACKATSEKTASQHSHHREMHTLNLSPPGCDACHPYRPPAALPVVRLLACFGLG